MTTMVRFHAGGRSFAVPVQSTTGVRAAHGIVALPGSRSDVIGILPGIPPVTILSTLGTGRDHILMLTIEDVSFGLLVDEVTGIVRVDDNEIGPPPSGQDEGLIAGTLGDIDNVTLIADLHGLANRL